MQRVTVLACLLFLFQFCQVLTMECSRTFLLKVCKVYKSWFWGRNTTYRLCFALLQGNDTCVTARAALLPSALNKVHSSSRMAAKGRVDPLNWPELFKITSGDSLHKPLSHKAQFIVVCTKKKSVLKLTQYYIGDRYSHVIEVYLKMSSMDLIYRDRKQQQGKTGG